jgi:hypothetical protein
MLNEEQQAASVTLTGAQAVVALQVINRLTSTGGLKDIELTPVGQARDGIVAALQEATGVNFDEAKAQQEAMQRQRIAKAREEYAAAQAAAAEAAEKAASETPAETAAEAEDEVVIQEAAEAHAAAEVAK